MASTWSSLKFELIGTGEQAGTWGTTTNANLGDAIEQAIGGKADITMSSTSQTLTLTDTTALQDARALYLNLSGTPGGAATLNVPAVEKAYIVNNGTNQQVTVKVTGQTGVVVPVGKVMALYDNGTDVVDTITHLSSLTLGAALPVASGGTGVTTSTGTGSVVLSNSPTLVTPALGTPSSGTLTSCTGLPISTGVSGLGTNVATALAVNVGSSGAFVTNGGALGTPSSGTLTSCTGLPISTGVSGLGANVATFLATPSSANLAAAVTDETGSGALVFATSPTLVTPALGTPSSGTLTSCTGLPLSTGVTGTLPLANGGTGAALTDPNADRIFFWDDSAGSTAFLTVSTGLSISGTTLSATGTGGTVTSVSGTGTVNGITLTGTVTSSGSLTLGGTLSGVNLTSQVTGTLPVANGGTGATTSTGSGAVVLATSPTLTTPNLGTPSAVVLTNATGTAASLTAGTATNATNVAVTTSTTSSAFKVPFANTTASTTGNYGLLQDSTATFTYNPSTNTLTVGTVAAALSGNATTATTLATARTIQTNLASTSAASFNGSANITPGVTGTLPVANGGTGVTTSTGSGSVVLSTSPSLTTPVLGTPTSGNLGNCTADGTNKVGYRNVPAVGTKTGSYTLATGDVGKYVQVGSGGSITIPNAIFAEGDVISIFNNTTGNITITCTITTAYIAGTNSDKASVALATRGVATILFISSTVCVISGNVT